jgi:putative colanic acid biosysnthesis UDP-glucose lipid carrier transferase
MVLKVMSKSTVQYSNSSIIGFGKAYLDPCLIVGILLLLNWFHEGRVRGPVTILAVLAFALTFPGSIPFRHRPRGLIREIVSSWGLIMGLLLALGYGSGTIENYNRDMLYQWALITPVVLLVAHLVSPNILAKLLASQPLKQAIIVGLSESGLKLKNELSRDKFLHTQVAGFFDDRQDSPGRQDFPEIEVLGNLEAVANFARQNQIDQIYIALPMSSQPRIHKLLDDLRDTTASIYFVPDIFVFDLIQARIGSVNGIPTMAVCESPFHGTTGLIKRMSDVLLSCAILLLCMPLMLLIALGVKLTSRGPAIFRQRRYGLDGRDIVVYKFRSMTVQQDGAQVPQAVKGDARVTRFGAFLRRTSLDELPQFINVIQGRMSIVGPRPHAVAHNETYRSLVKGYMIRHKVKPGITGLAQIRGARGETDTVDKMKLRIEYDLEYLRNWSLRLDMLIILKTIPALMGRDDIY